MAESESAEKGVCRWLRVESDDIVSAGVGSLWSREVIGLLSISQALPGL